MVLAQNAVVILHYFKISKTLELSVSKIYLTSLTFHFQNTTLMLARYFSISRFLGVRLIENIFDQVKNQFIEEIKALGRLDGILLLMHGAMYVEGIEDPEGDWISSVRIAAGPDCIISLSYDLHGQITDKIIKNIDAFAAFKTAPHIDVKETYRRSASMLVSAINENYRPIVLWSSIPVLVSGEMSSTVVEPCKTIYERSRSI